MASDLRLTLLACAVLIGAQGLRAEDAPAPPSRQSPDKTRKERTPEEIRDREQRETIEHMRRLVSMNDAQIARMRATLDNVEKIPAERRLEIRKKLESLRSATPEERDAFIRELREKHGLFQEPREHKDKPDKGAPKPPAGEEQRRAFRNVLEKHFNSLPPAEGKAEKEKFLALSREEKFAYIKALREKYGLPPEAPRERKDGERPKRPAPEAPVAPPPPGDPFAVPAK